MFPLTRFPRLFGAVICLFFCLPLFGMAQSNSPEDVAGNLKGKIFFIRGMYVENDLKFDSQANAIGTATPGPFYLSTLKVEKSHIKGATLEVAGHRGMFIFNGPDIQGQTPRFVPFAAEVHVRVVDAPDRVEVLQGLINKIFATDLKDALNDKSPEEQQRLLNSLPVLAPVQTPALPPAAPSALPPAANPPSASGSGNNKMELNHVGTAVQIMRNNNQQDGVSLPRLTHSVPLVDPKSIDPAASVSCISWLMQTDSPITFAL